MNPKRGIIFTEKQIKELEDKIINKIILPTKVIEKIHHSYSVPVEQLMIAQHNLKDLMDWVRSLRK